jgi:hypothetical protein
MLGSLIPEDLPGQSNKRANQQLALLHYFEQQKTLKVFDIITCESPSRKYEA